jgi:hypothetical protein
MGLVVEVIVNRNVILVNHIVILLEELDIEVVEDVRSSIENV